MKLLALFEKHLGDQKLTVAQMVRGLCARVDALEERQDEQARLLANLRAHIMQLEEIVRVLECRRTSCKVGPAKPPL